MSILEKSPGMSRGQQGHDCHPSHQTDRLFLEKKILHTRSQHKKLYQGIIMGIIITKSNMLLMCTSAQIYRQQQQQEK